MTAVERHVLDGGGGDARVVGEARVREQADLEGGLGGVRGDAVCLEVDLGADGLADGDGDWPLAPDAGCEPAGGRGRAQLGAGVDHKAARPAGGEGKVGRVQEERESRQQVGAVQRDGGRGKAEHDAEGIAGVVCSRARCDADLPIRVCEIDERRCVLVEAELVTKCCPILRFSGWNCCRNVGKRPICPSRTARVRSCNQV